MAEEEMSQKWKTLVVDSGLFDNIPHPDEGYGIGKAVAGRDGVTYGVVGVKPDGRLMLSRDKATHNVDLVVDKNFVRLGEALVKPLIDLGLVSKPGKNVQFIEKSAWTKGKNN